MEKKEASISTIELFMSETVIPVSVLLVEIGQDEAFWMQLG